MTRNALPTVDPTANPIHVIARHCGGAPVGQPALIRWLLDEGRRMPEDAAMFDALCWRLVGNGIPLARATLHVGTLHPQLLGFGFRWWRDRHLTEEFAVAHGVRETQDYLSSPIRPAIEHGESVRYDLRDAATRERFPLLADLHAAGIVDYFAAPLSMSAGRHQVATWATDSAGGFTEDDLACLRELMPALSSVAEIRAMRRIAGHLLDTYLGRYVGPRVLAGQIHRGRGDRMRAIVMASDLRGFTRLSDRLPGEEVIELLDDYFERVADPVHAEGGEVLKFIGDGVLSIFPVDADGESVAAGAALRAATSVLQGLESLNETNGANGRRVPLRAGIGLHLGEVIFGNVGAPDRLDFTVIGPAVNLAFRLEGLTKRFNRPLLASKAFARAAPQPLVSLGFQPVRGIADPEELFGLPGANDDAMI